MTVNENRCQSEALSSGGKHQKIIGRKSDSNCIGKPMPRLLNTSGRQFLRETSHIVELEQAQVAAKAYLDIWLSVRSP